MRLLYPVGIPITTSGNDVVVYEDPALTIVNPEMVPAALTVAIILAPNPMVDAMLTTGGFLYPEPPPLTIILEIVPAAETTAVAAAPILGTYP